jgi:hypothetical protein
MATTGKPRNPAEPPQRRRKEPWERWYTRVAVVLSTLAAVVVIAVFGDPEHESWHAKTWELVCDLITRSHPVADCSR